VRPQAQPAYSGSQIRIKGRPPLPSRRLDACKAASQQPRRPLGVGTYPYGGNPQRPALGSPPHHATPKRFPLFLSVFLRTKKNSWLSATFPLRRRAALSCHPPGVHCGSGCIAGCRRCGWGQFLGGSSVVTSREIRVKCRLARWEEELFCTCVDKKSILLGKTPSPNWVATRGGSSGRPQRSSSATEMPTP
jgi:hypothetical protein